MRIALDAMGGDDAPGAMIIGTVAYCRAHPEHEVLLVGVESIINDELKKVGVVPGNCRVIHAPDVIAMGDKIQALRDKPDDSMNKAAQLVKSGEADAMVLCGNTACSVAAAQLHLRRIPGVKRAGILTPLPTPQEPTWVCDCGANSVGKPEHLVQFAQMTSIFMEAFYGKSKPSVGVLSIGSEDGKGDDLTQEALNQLRDTNLNVYGNVEGNDIFKGTVNIVVCDGFTGNVVLKTAEGVASMVSNILREEMARNIRRKVGYLLAKPSFDALRDRTHWSKVGGCLLIGVDGITIIGHGRSDATAVQNALDQATRCCERQVLEKLRNLYRPKKSAQSA